MYLKHKVIWIEALLADHWSLRIVLSVTFLLLGFFLFLDNKQVDLHFRYLTLFLYVPFIYYIIKHYIHGCLSYVRLSLSKVLIPQISKFPSTELSLLCFCLCSMFGHLFWFENLPIGQWKKFDLFFAFHGFGSGNVWDWGDISVVDKWVHFKFSFLFIFF